MNEHNPSMVRFYVDMEHYMGFQGVRYKALGALASGIGFESPWSLEFYNEKGVCVSTVGTIDSSAAAHASKTNQLITYVVQNIYISSHEQFNLIKQPGPINTSY